MWWREDFSLPLDSSRRTRGRWTVCGRRRQLRRWPTSCIRRFSHRYLTLFIVLGNRWPVMGNRWPVMGNRCPVMGNRLPVMGNRWPVMGNRWPVMGNRWPVMGNRWPVMDNRWQVMGNRWPVIGNRWPVMGNRWPVMGYRWPVMGYRWPVMGDKWPVLGNRWPVMGNKWPVLGNRWPVMRIRIHVSWNPDQFFDDQKSKQCSLDVVRKKFNYGLKFCYSWCWCLRNMYDEGVMFGSKLSSFIHRLRYRSDWGGGGEIEEMGVTPLTCCVGWRSSDPGPQLILQGEESTMSYLTVSS